MAPSTSGIAALLNMSNPVTTPQLKALEAATKAKEWRLRHVAAEDRHAADDDGRDDLELVAGAGDRID